MRRTFALFLSVLLTAGSLGVLAAIPQAAAAGQVDLYLSGLEYPIALAFAPDGRIFYAEWFTGNIRIIRDDEPLPTPFYTLVDTVTGGERGLLGLALDPEFPTMPYVYAYHTFNDRENGTVYNRIVQITADGDTGVTHTVILRMPPLSSATNHNGGVIAFGPDDRMLYAVVGENADPALSQDPSSPMGKVLRMTREGWAPPDNPFVNDTRWFNLTYTYGHRNMFGLAFHPLGDGILSTENGPECNDEVNLLKSGENFGWGPNYTCSTPPDPPNNTNRDGPNPVLPIWWWARTICPTNAAVYVGPYFPDWQGDLFMGDCNFGTLHRLDMTAPNYDTIESDTAIWTSPDLIFDVEMGPDGAIWITTAASIYRLWDVARPPVADFTANPNPVVLGNPVEFDASASDDPDGTIVLFLWNFGDGSNDTGERVRYTYTRVGIFNVTLTVVDNESHNASAYRDVEVVASAPVPPVATFIASPSPAAPNAPITFDGSGSFDPDGGTIVSYLWDFGDASGGTGNPINHAYESRGTYTINLIVRDSQNLTANTTRTLVVTIPPQPAIAYDPTTIFVGTVVNFDGTGSVDPDGNITSWSWDFGDTFEGVGRQATHTYADWGLFTVTLTVRDNAGMDGTKSMTIEVRNRRPTIVSSTPENLSVTVVAGSDHTFSVSASDPDDDDLAYTWRINNVIVGGDSNSLVFRQSSPGTYVVNVTVSDGGDSDSREWTVVVASIGPQGGIDLWIAIILPTVAVLAAIGTLAGVVAWRRRKRMRGGPLPP